MACDCNAKTYCVIAGSTVLLMARVKKIDNTYLTLATTSAIRVDVYELDDPKIHVDEAGVEIDANSDGTYDAFDEPAKTAVFDDTLQTDSRWTDSADGDSTGFNVAYAIALPTSNEAYDVRITITASDGHDYVIAWNINAE
jgi:hypothetical protein